MFQVADEIAFEKYHFLELVSVVRNSQGDGATWRCETKCGKYLRVRQRGAIIHMSLAETEIELDNENIVLRVTPKKLVGNIFDFSTNREDMLADLLTNTIEFNKLKDFMGWSCDEDQIWDN